MFLFEHFETIHTLELFIFVFKYYNTEHTIIFYRFVNNKNILFMNHCK